MHLHKYNICPGTFTEALSVIMKEWKQPKFPTVGNWLRRYLHTMENYAILRIMKKKISIY